MEYKKFYNYDVYENGDVFSHYRNKFLTKSLVKGYIQYTLFINGKIERYKAHRLVGMLFLPLPLNYKDLMINHKDGNKLNNHYTNLEWCDAYWNNLHARIFGLNNISKSNSDRWKDDEFRKRTSKHISEGAIKYESNKGKKNGRFRYEIYDKNGKEYNREELSKLLNLSQSYTDTLIHKLALNENVPNKKVYEYGIKIIDTKKS